ncbi:hypothetical protein J7E63_15645 [Bacillus sp. ISL-75]|uniref:hypothetical protein n=1 Tax=Bacillus sp. ISL-75 TaxID=2819137 RepID=UPI001BEBD394|nr:hypothetical protein [Bacillus sp. ISL-75]MBT2728364.1 hypothetical protein [Bacillus sp. ISL-75]
MKDLEKEILVIKNMIDILNRCLMISITNARIRETINTRKDIKICKKELKKLLEARDEIGNVAREKKQDAEVQ